MIFAILAILMMYNTSSQTLNANAQQGDFNIATAGDWGCSDRTEGTVDDMEGRSPE
jgi:hypothetical protein